MKISNVQEEMHISYVFLYNIHFFIIALNDLYLYSFIDELNLKI